MLGRCQAGKTVGRQRSLGCDIGIPDLHHLSSVCGRQRCLGVPDLQTTSLIFQFELTSELKKDIEQALLLYIANTRVDVTTFVWCGDQDEDGEEDERL